MSMSAARSVGALAALLGCAAGCAVTPRLAPATITPGCYVLNAGNWPTALVAQTGLTSLPGFVGLDTAVAGPLGRRVVLPADWRDARAPGRTAYWTELPHGDRRASVVLRFRGRAGDFVASLESSEEGYTGAGAAQAPDGGDLVPRVAISLAAIRCANLRLEGFAEMP